LELLELYKAVKILDFMDVLEREAELNDFAEGEEIEVLGNLGLFEISGQ